jgi:hypothetical protein
MVLTQWYNGIADTDSVSEESAFAITLTNASYITSHIGESYHFPDVAFYTYFQSSIYVNRE